jgi:PAS domain S-box-containing protein
LSPSKNDIDPRVLGQLLAAQSTYSVFSARQKMGEFVCRAVEGVPGVASCAACLPGAERPCLGGEPVPECADCDVPEGDVDHDPGHPCRLSNRAGIQIFPLKTQDRHFGFLLLKLEGRERYAPYEPFVSNLANSLAVNIDRQWQKERLEATDVELRRHREHLEELIRERTAELQLGLKREHHLNAVLRAVRNVNQLIVREKDRERLLQQACGILVETRGFRCVWIVRLGADGRVEAMAEAGIGPAFAGLRSQLERGELPECCRRALASEGLVALANPVVNCVSCPLPTEYRDTAGIAAPLRHEGHTYGVLIAALRAEMAADAEEISLFAEVAADLAFALHDIEMGRQRKRAEEARAESEKKHRALFETMSEGIIYEDHDGKIISANLAAERLLGLSLDQMQGRTSLDPRWKAIHADGSPFPGETHSLNVAAKTGKPATGEVMGIYNPKSGAYVWLSVNSTPEFLPGEKKPFRAYAVFRDITDRKRAEEALRQGAANLDAIFESSPVGMLILDETTNIVMANAAILVLCGGSKSDVLQHRPGNALRCVHSTKDPRGCGYAPQCPLCPARNGIETLLASGGAMHGAEVPLELNRNGEPRKIWLEIGAEPIMMNGRRHLCVAMEDITERKQGQEKLKVSDEKLRHGIEELEKSHAALQESEAKLQLTLHQAAVGIASVGLNKRFLNCNKAFCEFIGYSEEEMQQKTIADITYPEDTEIGMADLRAIVAGQMRASNVVKRYVRKDGAVVWGEVRINLLRGDKGQPLYFLPVVLDITERKRAEEALHENELKYRSLFETADDANLLFTDGHWVECNAGALRIFGCTREQIIGAHPSRFSPPTQPDGRSSEEQAIKKINLAFASRPQSFEWEHCRADGAPFAAEVRLNRLDLGGKPHIQAIVRDISERKRAEHTMRLHAERVQILLKLNQMTEATLQQVTDFALEEAVRLTQSTIGYLAFLNEDESVLTMHAWSKSAMAECAIVDKPIVYPIRSTGLWGEAVRQRKAVITNDYTADNPLKKSYPKGHVLVKRHMNIPVFEGSRIVLVAGVGNKSEEYDQDDGQQLTLLMEGMWRLIERKRSEEALRQNVEELRASNDELEQFNRAAVGRELRMIELKLELNELCKQAGLPPRYLLHSATESGKTDSNTPPTKPGQS